MQPKVTQPRITATEKQAKALELRKRGYTYPEIAQEVGYQSKGSAYKAVEAGLRKTLQEPADELRRMEAERLDAMLKGLWKKAANGDTWSVDRVLGIMDRRAKLFGLDSKPDDDTAAKAREYLDLYDKAVADAQDRSI